MWVCVWVGVFMIVCVCARARACVRARRRVCLCVREREGGIERVTERGTLLLKTKFKAMERRQYCY